MNKLLVIKNRITQSRLAIASSSLRKVVSSGVMTLALTILAAYAQNPNQVSDDGGKTWHPYGESQSNSSSESSSSASSGGGMSEAERGRRIDADMRNNASPAVRAQFKAMEAGRRGDWNSAVRYDQECLRLAQAEARLGSRPDFDGIRGNIAVDQGRAAEAKKDWNSAIRYYKEAIRLQPNNRFLQQSLARVQAAAAATGKLEAVKAGSELREEDVHRFHFVKSKQLPPPPILKGDLPTDPAKRAAVQGELDDYMRNWKASNQKYQKAAPKEAARIKEKMETDNKKFKARLTKDYAVTF
jgi:tetratricopeptide (TPR) repeat protein